MYYSEKGNLKSRFKGEENEFSIRHVEFEVPVNYQNGNVQRYWDIPI